jgi:diguanylate cyclase (GGDEF)-like protein
LFNRRYIDSILDAQFDMFKRVHQRFGIVMLDVDKFKYINDTFGHLAGDEALRLVASSLRSTMRGMDYLARFGGDEFIIVCQMAETSGMESLGQRAIGLVHNSVLSSQDGKSIYLSISAGAAVAERQDATAQDVLKRADEALYRAKNRGGNEFVLD